MTETKTNLSKKGNKCRICTGCGLCFSQRNMNVVSDFILPGNMDEMGACGQDMPPYFIVADIGTTTIAMQLRRTKDGKVLQTYVQENPQRIYGADVLSRIEASKDIVIKETMQQVVKNVLLQGINQLCISKNGEEGIHAANCKLVIAANTTMVHILMGYDVTGLGQFPFVTENLEEIHTVLFGFETLILPGMSAFIGGDILADIVALSMYNKSGIALLVDLGTNGEIVLGNQNKMMATSVAAGPAFESETENFGTDMMALVACLLEKGMLDETGLLCDPYFEEGITIGGIRITQPYIRSLQMAKAAICTGIEILAQKYGLQHLTEIDNVYLAGGMGYYLDVKAAAQIGLLPACLADKAFAVGNAVLEGAYRYGRAPKPEIACKCETYNMAKEHTFTEKYIANMQLQPFTITE